MLYIEYEDQACLEYQKYECVRSLPIAFEDKYIGNSQYYYETFEDKDCNEIKTKKEIVAFIGTNYVDGNFFL